MAEDPFSGDVLKLEGEKNRFRRRVGSYRILFRMEQSSKSVYVSAIVRRTTTTY
jgi:mRNA-degrading endonuclease RelE of RelBE toxin-antitoxin system